MTSEYTTNQRSEPGQGAPVVIYQIGRADCFADSMTPAYGKISAGCGGPGGDPREDFAVCIWPVIVKVKPDVSDEDLVQHLRDLADLIKGNPRPPIEFSAVDEPDLARLKDTAACLETETRGAVKAMTAYERWLAVNWCAEPTAEQVEEVEDAWVEAGGAKMMCHYVNTRLYHEIPGVPTALDFPKNNVIPF